MYKTLIREVIQNYRTTPAKIQQPSSGPDSILNKGTAHLQPRPTDCGLLLQDAWLKYISPSLLQDLPSRKHVLHLH